MMSWLSNILAVLTPYTSDITHTDVIAWGGVIFIVWESLYLRKKIHASDVANCVTTTGIGFTFLGIVLALGGLSDLGKQASVSQKINELLGGIFVAFVPSIAGAAIAVLTHLRPNIWHKPIVEDPGAIETDTDAQILRELKQLNTNLVRLNTNLVGDSETSLTTRLEKFQLKVTENQEALRKEFQDFLTELKRLNTNLVGDSETSLTTRLEKFQLKVTENQEALRKEFQDFAQNVSRNIIEALKQSMKDLNEKLGEQFGENFRRFADVIPRLLEWQEHYRDTIQDTQHQIKTQSDHLNSLLEALDRAQESFTGIAEHVGKIAECAHIIDQTTNTITASLTQAAEGIQTMRADAEQFQTASESLNASIASQTEQAVKQHKALEQSAESLAGIAEKTAILDKTAQQLNQHLQAMVSGLGSVDRLSDTLQGKAESIEKNLTDLTDGVCKTLASNLRGISEALVDDYSQLQRTIRQITKQG